MNTTKKWDDVYSNLKSISQDDINEIDLKVNIIGKIIETRKNVAITQDGTFIYQV